MIADFGVLGEFRNSKLWDFLVNDHFNLEAFTAYRRAYEALGDHAPSHHDSWVVMRMIPNFCKGAELREHDAMLQAQMPFLSSEIHHDGASPSWVAVALVLSGRHQDLDVLSKKVYGCQLARAIVARQQAAPSA